MATSLPEHFTHSHVIADDGSLTFACPTDAGLWPWLALPPDDPVVVQALNYYASYEISIARGHYRHGQWTALTQTGWRCGEMSAGHAARGIAFATEGDGSAGYHMLFYDQDDALVYDMRGKGVVFKNRDFEAWRKEQKRELGDRYDEREFPFAPADAVGMASPIESFVSMPTQDSGRPARGLVTRHNGFPPAHPYHDGSGDHVNASHLADACRQYLRLLLAAPELRITGGDMRFRRYVELGHPFHITMDTHTSAHNETTLQIVQGDTRCATIRLGHVRA